MQPDLSSLLGASGTLQPQEAAASVIASPPATHFPDELLALLTGSTQATGEGAAESPAQDAVTPLTDEGMQLPQIVLGRLPDGTALPLPGGNLPLPATATAIPAANAAVAAHTTAARDFLTPAPPPASTSPAPNAAPEEPRAEGLPFAQPLPSAPLHPRSAQLPTSMVPASPGAPISKGAPGLPGVPAASDAATHTARPAGDAMFAQRAMELAPNLLQRPAAIAPSVPPPTEPSPPGPPATSASGEAPPARAAIRGAFTFAALPTTQPSDSGQGAARGMVHEAPVQREPASSRHEPSGPKNAASAWTGQSAGMDRGVPSAPSGSPETAVEPRPALVRGTVFSDAGAAIPARPGYGAAPSEAGPGRKSAATAAERPAMVANTELRPTREAAQPTHGSMRETLSPRAEQVRTPLVQSPVPTAELAREPADAGALLNVTRATTLETPGTASSSAGARVGAEAAEQINEQLLRFTLRHASRDGRLTLQLHPRELGMVDVEFAGERGELNVAIVAREASTREVLEATLPRLRASLAEAGLSLGQIDVRQRDGSPDEQRHHTAAGDRPADGLETDAAPAQAARAEPRGLLDLYV